MGLCNVRKFVCVLFAVFFVIPAVGAVGFGGGILDESKNRMNGRHSGFDSTQQDYQKDFQQNQKTNQNTRLRSMGNNFADIDVYTNLFEIDDLPNHDRVKKIDDGLNYTEIKQNSLKLPNLNFGSETYDLISQENPSSLLSTGREIYHNPITGGVYHNFKPQSSDDPSVLNQNTRSSRASADLELWNINWEVKNEGWCEVTDPDPADAPEDPPNWYSGNQASIGSFFVDEETKITVTVKNNGDNSLTNVPVNLSINDFIHSYQPMKKNPETKYINSIDPDETKEISFYWTPPYATTSFRIYAEVDYDGDSDQSNNVLSWGGERVCKWWDDLESGVSSWNHYARTDITTSSVDDWHLTTTAFAQTDTTHSLANSWYEGYIDGPLATYPSDAYRNNNASSLESPTINFGNSVDEREWFVTGKMTIDNVQYDSFYYYVNCVNWLITGKTEDNDELRAGEVSDDGGITWNRPFNISFSGRLGEIGETQWYNYVFYLINQQASEVYIFPGIPFNFDVDNWQNVKFRHTFDSDDNNLQDIGYYVDDFVIFGNDNFTVPYRLSITEQSYPKTEGVPVLYQESQTSFKTKVKNYGEEKQFNVQLTIKEFDIETNEIGNVVHTKTQTGINLQTDDEKEIQWFWTPEDKGNYILTVTAGDLNEEWTPQDNKIDLILHVGPAKNANDVDVLIVDDDNSEGSRTIGKSYWFTNTENRMLSSLKANRVEVRVFTVGYNQTGPTYDVMKEYSCVIWMTGLENEYDIFGGLDYYSASNPDWDITIKPADETELSYYLDNLGKLILISPGYPYDKQSKGEYNPGENEFAKKYLHIDSAKSNETKWDPTQSQIVTRGTPNPLKGVLDTIMDGVEYLTYNTEPPLKFDDIGGWVEGVDDEYTEESIYQDIARTKYNVNFYNGKSFKTTYFAFNYYLINEKEDRNDCIRRILTSYGLLGGVRIEPFDNQERLKSIAPGTEVSFRLKVINIGKHADTMELSNTFNNKYKDWNSWFEVNGDKENSITIPGNDFNNKIYFHVQAPPFKDPEDYPEAGSKVEFNLKAISQNTGLENSTKVIAEVSAVGNITIECQEPKKTVDVNESVDFELDLLNETNGVDNVDVILSLKGSNTGYFKLKKDESVISGNQVEVLLEPNEINDDIAVQFTDGAHTIAGDYKITVDVFDFTNTIILDSLELTASVNQFYQVKCISDGDVDDGKVEFELDPNNYIDDGYISKIFSIKAQNFGNGIDEIKLNYEENENSEEITDWEFRIYSPDTETEISSINVSYYDESKTPSFGEEEILFAVKIPIDVDVGTYIVDFYIESSQLEIITALDEVANNRVQLIFEIKKPNLVFNLYNNEANMDNFRFTDNDEYVKINRDYERNNEFYLVKEDSRFDFLTIDFNIYIENIGDVDVVVNPSDIKLEILHFDDDGVKIIDATLQPEYPKTEKLISPNENASYTFTWDYINQSMDTEVKYTFKVTIDPMNEIIELDEFDNSNEVDLTIKHLKKPEEDTTEDSFLILLIFIIIIVIGIIAAGIILKKREKQD